MGPLRQTSVAGRWYPAEPDILTHAVAGHLAVAAVASLPPLRAIVAPHAGLLYSGPVAGFAYRAAGRTVYRTVVLVGPSHFVGFRGVSIWPRGEWATPGGRMRVDEALAAAIADAPASGIVERPDAHGREHALEMQMPFVAHLWPQAQIVPLVMGHQTPETAFGLGEAIAHAVAARPQPQPDGAPAHGTGAGDARIEADGSDVLLVASSDLSHYEDARVAAALDATVLRHVEDLDADGLMRALEHEPRHACGGGPIVAVLHAARQLGATHARVLHYADSGDVTGDKSAVVGYMAAAIW